MIKHCFSSFSGGLKENYPFFFTSPNFPVAYYIFYESLIIVLFRDFLDTSLKMSNLTSLI